MATGRTKGRGPLVGQQELDNMAVQIMDSLHVSKQELVRRINEVQAANASRRAEARKRTKELERRVEDLEARLALLAPRVELLERSLTERLQAWWVSLRARVA